MPDFQDLLHSREAQRLTQDTERLQRLRDAPETQRLFQLLSQSAGGDLEQVANRAVQGDTAALMAAFQQLTQNPEGQKLLRQMEQSIQ